MKAYAGVGSRKTPLDVQTQMRNFAIDAQRLDWTLRSGGADGADRAFASGVVGKEIYIPWHGFKGSRSNLVPTDEAFKLAMQFHPAWSRLSAPARQLHARNVHQVLGYDCKTPSRFVICWTPDGKASGGTGQAMRIAKGHGIPVFNLFRPDDLARAYEALA